MDPLQEQQLPSQIAQQQTQQYFSGPWYRRLLAGLSEGMAAQGKDYERPYDRFFKQALAQYQAQTPRLGAELRAKSAEDALEARRLKDEEDLKYKRERDAAINAIKQQQVDIDRLAKEAMAGDKASATKFRELWQGLSGDAAIKARASRDPEFAERYQDMMGKMDAQKAAIDAAEKMAGTPDKLGTPTRFQVVDRLNSEGVPERNTITIPGSPGISREGMRRQGMGILDKFMSGGQFSAGPQTNPLLQSFGEFTQPTQPPPSAPAPAALPGKIPEVTQVPRQEAIRPQLVSQEAVRLGKASIVLPTIEFPKSMQPQEGVGFRNQTDLKAFQDKRATINSTNEAAALMINLFVKDELKDITGPLYGSEAGEYLRRIGFLDPKTQQFMLSNTFLDQWKKKLYSETGMQANPIELATATQYFARLGNSPEANLKKTIMMALMSRAMLETAKLPGTTRHSKMVDISSGLVERTDEIVDNLKKGYAFDPRDFDLGPYVRKRYGVVTRKAK